MEYIAHRINLQEQLQKLPEKYGVEIDLRDGANGRIYMQHDPFIPGEDFEDYLKNYHHGTMILNIKSERVELSALSLLEKYKISNFFFLDSSFPMVKLLSDQGCNKLALRFSEYEGLDTIRNMAGRACWVWVDCFTRMPLDTETYKELKKLNYKICIVSPELQGQPEKLGLYARQLAQNNILPDAICTKEYLIDEWENTTLL